MVSTDAQARGEPQNERVWNRFFILGTHRVITRAVYFLNRSHSSREMFLDNDWEIGEFYNVTKEHSFSRTKPLSVIVQESAGRVLRIVDISTCRRHRTSMTGPSSDLQQHAKASNDADPLFVGSARRDMFRISSSRRST